MLIRLKKDLPPKHPGGRSLKEGAVIEVLDHYGQELIDNGYAEKHYERINLNRIPAHVKRKMELDERKAKELALSAEAKKAEKEDKK